MFVAHFVCGCAFAIDLVLLCRFFFDVFLLSKTSLMRAISGYDIPDFPVHLRVVHVEQEVRILRHTNSRMYGLALPLFLSAAHSPCVDSCFFFVLFLPRLLSSISGYW